MIDLKDLENTLGFFFKNPSKCLGKSLRKALGINLGKPWKNLRLEPWRGIGRSGRAAMYEFEPLMDATEAATLLQIHPKTLLQMARDGKVPAHRIGKYWRFRRTDLDRWLRSGVNCGRYAYRPREESEQ